jgi:hypothetical protein
MIIRVTFCQCHSLIRWFVKNPAALCADVPPPIAWLLCKLFFTSFLALEAAVQALTFGEKKYSGRKISSVITIFFIPMIFGIKVCLNKIPVNYTIG